MDQEFTVNPGTTIKGVILGETPTIPEEEVEAVSQEEIPGEGGEGMEEVEVGMQKMDSTIDTQRATIDSMIVSMRI